MNKQQVIGGTVHQLPKDLKKSLVDDPSTLVVWNSLTPLARNEWICWVETVKMAETRDRHIGRVHSDLAKGKRRPCCWSGCAHRERNGK